MRKEVKWLDTPSIEEGRKRVNKIETLNLYLDKNDENLKLLKGKKYFIRTYGCQANIRYEEVMSGILEEIGLTKADNISIADVVILNTCAVRENAEDKVFGQIGDLKNIKSNNKNMLILVCGCMIEQKHILDKILKTFTYVDGLFGTHNIKDLPLILSYLKAYIHCHIHKAP